jgi:hypothetical protein
MSEKCFSTACRYCDVIVGLYALGVAAATLVIAIQENSSWNMKDSLGLGMFFVPLCAFFLLRPHIYQRKASWLYFSMSALIVVGTVLLCRRWTLPSIVASSILLIPLLVLQTKPIVEPLSKRDLLPIFVISANVLFTVMLLEIGLRLVPGLLTEGARLRIHWREGSQLWYTPHPYIGHLHIPDGHASGRTARPGQEVIAKRDPWGFRNNWPWPEQVDILAIGDSFTYSQMVDEDQAWTTILARGLPHSHVLNLGLIGAAPQQYLRLYETFGVDLSPKVLLVGIFLGNDLWDAGQFARWWNAGGDGAFPEFRSKRPASGLHAWLVHRMKSLYLFALLQDLRESYSAGRFFSGQTIELPAGGRLQLVPSLLPQMAAYTQPERPQFTLVLETIEQIYARAQQNHSHCLILFFPSKEEVYLPMLGEKPTNLAASFIPELETRGIPYLDLWASFRQHASAGEQLFFEVDGHPNGRGYALIAEGVLAHLRENARKYGLQDRKSVSLR